MFSNSTLKHFLVWKTATNLGMAELVSRKFLFKRCEYLKMNLKTCHVMVYLIPEFFSTCLAKVLQTINSMKKFGFFYWKFQAKEGNSCELFLFYFFWTHPIQMLNFSHKQFYLRYFDECGILFWLSNCFPFQSKTYSIHYSNILSGHNFHFPFELVQ